MRSCFVLLFASLLTSCEAQGTIEPFGFVLKGRDLLLKLHDDPPEGVLAVEWKVNKTVTLVRFEPSGKANVLHNITRRFKFPENKFSVILKNLQEVDSGVYSAVAGTSTEDKLVAEYKVTVQGPVSPVKLIVDRVDSRSSESCDLHVTCRTHNSHINSTFRCVDWVCSQEGGERSEVTTSGASLQIYLLNNVIICNHRNKVHWTQDLVPAEHLCPSKHDPPLHFGWVTAICILTVIVIMIVGLFFWLYRKRRFIRNERSIKTLLQNVTQRSSSYWSPDYYPDVGRRFEDLVHSVIQRSRSTDDIPAFGRRFKDLVHEALLELTSAPRQMWNPADAAERRFEDLVNSVFQELTSALPQMRNPAHDPDVGRRFEDLVREVIQAKTSASPQNWSPEDDITDLGRRFEKIVHEVYLISESASPQNWSPEDPDPALSRNEDLVDAVLLEEL
ncbi:uncharacterized protein LOC119199146 [Pungitius pungitius]|uniref:uncharacterized protein LOC119199146 n=1 Tax=Pungitius pungitius TaxID=134920 RepID=UPI002E0F2ABB